MLYKESLLSGFNSPILQMWKLRLGVVGEAHLAKVGRQSWNLNLEPSS